MDTNPNDWIPKEAFKSLNKDRIRKFLMKVVVLGDIQVGKSNIIRRLLGYNFRELDATVGIEMGFIDMKNIDPDNPKSVLSMQIWDTSGAEKFKAITCYHIRNCDGAILVYDITSQSSFENLPYWYDIITKESKKDVVIYLIGSKADLAEDKENRRKISKDVAIQFCKANRLSGFAECSAKSDKNIKASFESFSKCLYNRNKKKMVEQNTGEKQRIIDVDKYQSMKCC